MKYFGKNAISWQTYQFHRGILNDFENLSIFHLSCSYIFAFRIAKSYESFNLMYSYILK